MASKKTNTLRGAGNVSDPEDRPFRICFVGSQCGKSSIIMRLLLNEFASQDDPTIEDSHYTEIEFEGQKLRIDLLDTAGNESYAYLYEKWFTWADGFVMVYSVASAFTFDMVPLYHERIRQFFKRTSKIPLVLVGTQTDRKENQEVINKEGQSLALKFNCLFEELSAKLSSQDDIKKLLCDLVTEIKQARKLEELQQINKQAGPKKKDAEKIVVSVDSARKIGSMSMTKKDAFKGWKKVWCALKDGIFYIFTQEKYYKMKTPTIAENLLYCSVKEVRPPKETKKDKHFYFELSRNPTAADPQPIQYFFQFDSEEEWLDWLNLLEYNIQLYQKKEADTKERLKYGSNESGAHALKSLQEIPENRSCADCGAENPDWLIDDIGAIVCVQCAGVHRGLRPDKAKHVKSVMLDSLGPEILQLAKIIGNSNVNRVYESAAPSGLIKPRSTDTRKEKQIWINAKYLEKRFIRKEEFPLPVLTLKSVLSHPVGKDTFHQFLKTEFSSENLDFWDQCEQLKSCPETEIEATTEAIYVRFLASGAADEVNIADQIKKEVQKNHEVKENMMKRDVFARAQGSIFELMEADSWKRYQHSEQVGKFNEFLREDQLAEKLWTSIMRNSVLEVNYWIAQGADVNWNHHKENKAALHLAALKSSVHIALLLILNGADLQAKDAEGHSATWFAEKGHRMEMINFLSKYVSDDIRQQKGLNTRATLRPRKQNDMPNLLVKFDSRFGLNNVLKDSDNEEKPAAEAATTSSLQSSTEQKQQVGSTPSSPTLSPNDSRKLGQSQKSEFKRLFSTTDLKQAGRLSKDQIKGSFVPKITAAEFDKIFSLADLDKDGMLDEEEFIIACALLDWRVRGTSNAEVGKADVLPDWVLTACLDRSVIVFPNGDIYIGGFNKEGVYHGRGKYIYSNGSSYSGLFANGQYNGWGIFIGANGDRYEGHFKDDKYHGKGKCLYSNSDSYTGEFFEGERHGNGVYEYSNGNRYEGAFRIGACHGRGTFTYTNGDKYEGEFVNGEYSTGMYHYANQDEYKGTFVDGKPDGKGVFIYSNGDKYEGEIRAGSRDGRGKYVQKNGNTYEGNYVGDMLHGLGSYEQQGNRYEGNFKFGKANGTGKFCSATGDVYEGEFQDDLFHGNGKCQYSDGSNHVGSYAKGKRQGEGKLTKANGDVFQGIFDNDMMVRGIYFWKTGEKYQGEFKNGVPHGKGKFTSRDLKVFEGTFANGMHVPS
eukprot:TRINITY_DN2269_c0_g1_i1.p1 TRINITY_DN2269_c0_g1~~TRINITY_DN2269_c0_g1_i1.p1  ORF type:complete len:1220 (+),score=341.95 TRINITY_DN2269_c0_g1_i1:204-3863(+)